MKDRTEAQKNVDLYQGVCKALEVCLEMKKDKQKMIHELQAMKIYLNAMTVNDKSLKKFYKDVDETINVLVKKNVKVPTVKLAIQKLKLDLDRLKPFFVNIQTFEK